MSRTKSLTGGPQDIGMMIPQPAPAASGAVHPQWLRELEQRVGLSQRTSFKIQFLLLKFAARLAPPGTVISKLDQNIPRVGTNGGMPNQPSLSINEIGLPDGGVPPLATQQPPVQIHSIGLPDGGVPPQSAGHTNVPSQPPLQTAQVPISTQPLDLSALEASGSTNSGKPPVQPSQPVSVRPGQVPRGAPASVCFKTGLVHLEQNQLSDALSCFDEAFLALAKDQSRGSDIKAQATICAQYKIAVTLLQEIGRLQKVQGSAAISAKDEMARLSRHLGSLPLLARHRISCIRTAIKRNIEVQNYAYAKQMLDLLLSKAPPGKQDELRSLIDLCVQRGLTNKSIDPIEDPSQFCAATLSRLSTIGYDVCDLCGAKFTALAAPGCIICGMGSIKRSDALSGAISGPVPSPFG
ncbi:hypothetical protein Ancab_026017 [Ancistrocladus abbreviatus]